MTFEEIKAAIFKLSDSEQKRLITEVLTEILPKVCTDEACFSRLRFIMDEEAVRMYKEQHMGGI